VTGEAGEYFLCEDCREHHRECRALPRRTLNIDTAVMSLSNPGADRQTQTGATLGMRPCGVGPVEAVEDPGMIFRLDSDPGVLDRDMRRGSNPRQRELHLTSGIRILDRVVDEVQQ
jgi:hypothetical protein